MLKNILNSLLLTVLLGIPVQSLAIGGAQSATPAPLPPSPGSKLVVLSAYGLPDGSPAFKHFDLGLGKVVLSKTFSFSGQFQNMGGGGTAAVDVGRASFFYTVKVLTPSGDKIIPRVRTLDINTGRTVKDVRITPADTGTATFTALGGPFYTAFNPANGKAFVLVLGYAYPAHPYLFTYEVGYVDLVSGKYTPQMIPVVGGAGEQALTVLCTNNNTAQFTVDFGKNTLDCRTDDYNVGTHIAFTRYDLSDGSSNVLLDVPIAPGENFYFNPTSEQNGLTLLEQQPNPFNNSNRIVRVDANGLIQNVSNETLSQAMQQGPRLLVGDEYLMWQGGHLGVVSVNTHSGAVEKFLIENEFGALAAMLGLIP